MSTGQPDHQPDQGVVQVGQPPVGAQALITELTAIRRQLLKTGDRVPAEVHQNFRPSAANLLHYLALRQRDLRTLQASLAELGLSSLGRSESHVLATVNAVLATLQRLAGQCVDSTTGNQTLVSFQQGARFLHEHTRRLMGGGDKVHIMVTMPSEAAGDAQLIRELLQAGMDCARINCAHDGPEQWSAMIANLESAQQDTGRCCRVMMDLAGPKLRTGPIVQGPDVLKYRPRRDAYGRLIEPAHIWLSDDLTARPAPAPADASLQVATNWLAGIKPGESIKFRDTRDASRHLTVLEVTLEGCWLEGRKTAYLDNGVMFYRHAGGEGRVVGTFIGGIPSRPNSLHLTVGDRLIVTGDGCPGEPAKYDEAGRVLAPARVSCTLPEILGQVNTGESIWFDDGKIGGMIEQAEQHFLQVKITHTSPRGSRLRADKGINLPESSLDLPALTRKDREDLAFVARHADIVALSFANSSEDVRDLKEALAAFGAEQPGIVLKIETLSGFRHLPDMLLEAMSSPACGVMIARGDLAVESGFERLAELQEEILWLCEAAHVPVIWATQVLENLAKTGAPTRAEITDAAMAHRSECVMLNKGPHIVETVRTLDNILERMGGHQFKKQSMLRKLHLAADWLGSQ
jgi:pyruvate kinase